MAITKAVLPLSVFALFLWFITPAKVYAQDVSEYDEITVFFSVPRIGGTEIPAVVRDEVIYLSVTDIFNFLKIKNLSTPGFDNISGFFINQQDEYIIDRINNIITYQGKGHNLKPGDLVRTETNIYLKFNYFGEIFGLNCSFNFRSLSVTLNTKIELPVIREMRLEQMRRNVSQIKGDIETDTSINRSYPFFHFGMADWAAMSTQQVNGTTDTRLALNLGSILAGGEANVSLNYNSNSPFKERDQYYLWRYANNDHKAVRQVMLGKISSDASSSLVSPVVGIQFTNTPTTYRSSYGSYTLSDFTEPGWLVELYVNNVLVDYKKADASGFFTFEVPLVYGSTSVKLQFYGPWGEERSKEQNINIPFNFLPVGNFEYKVSAGVVEDSLNSRFSRVNFDYGVSRHITVGGGVEYLSSVKSGSFMPFVNTSVRLTPNLILSGVYTHGVSVSGLLNFRLPSDIQLDVNYVKYDKNQKAINTSYLEERKVALSVPIRTNGFTLFSRFSVNQFIMPQSQYTSAEVLFSGAIAGVNTNLTTYAFFSDITKTDVYSNLALSIRLPGAFILTPQTQFNYSKGKFASIKCGLEKHLFKSGFLNLSYEQNFIYEFQNLEIGFRYDFSFAQIGFSARRNKNSTTFVESASGSVMFDAKTEYTGASSRVSVGKGGLAITPFLDINCNGKRDNNEPKAHGLQIHINGGRIEHNEKDTTIRVFDLEPYANYLVTMNGTGFDNIAWRLRNKTMDVVVDPNKFKLINVPVSVVGEVAGTVFMASGDNQRGQGRITVNIYRQDNTIVSSTLTESDGYFSYLGLAPGEYSIGIDTLQMSKLDMSAYPSVFKFTISADENGDVKDGFEFVIRHNNVVVGDPIVKDTVSLSIPKDTAVIVSNIALYKVQLMALRKPIIIEEHFSKLISDVPGIHITESRGKDGWFRYSAGEFTRRSEASELEIRIRNAGWQDCFIPVTEKAPRKFYRVQLLVMKRHINIKAHFANILSAVPGLKITETLGEDGLYRYGTETFGNLSEALQWQRKIKSGGWGDSFISTR